MKCGWGNNMLILTLQPFAHNWTVHANDFLKLYFKQSLIKSLNAISSKSFSEPTLTFIPTLEIIINSHFSLTVAKKVLYSGTQPIWVGGPQNEFLVAILPF